MQVNTYGNAPYRAALLHGGPGAPGSLAGLAAEMSAFCGVLEPLQSRYSIAALVDELKEQLAPYGRRPLTLIGHSWGAWLAGLFAREHPEQIQNLILVGCGPLTADYVQEIAQRRRANLTAPEQAEFNALLCKLEGANASGDDTCLARLGELAHRSDSFCPYPSPRTSSPSPAPDGQMYARIWPEAAALRQSGLLLAAFAGLSCPVTVIHGENDPHPPRGVLTPLGDAGVPVKAHILPRCGHTPWEERWARDEFFRILREELGC